jgi:hypothetical protein
MHARTAARLDQAVSLPVAIVLFCAAPARALPLVLLEDLRQVRSEASICDPTCDEWAYADEQAAPAAPFTAWDGYVAIPDYEASQSSTATPAGLAGSGFGRFGRDIDVPELPFWSGDVGTTSSIYEIVFEVIAPTQITLSGTLSILNPYGPGNLVGGASYELSSGTEVVTALSLDASSPSQPPGDFPFAYSGLLTPGTYTFRAEGYTQDYTEGRAGWQFELNVPEPRTGLLLGSALIALLSRRPRARR